MSASSCSVKATNTPRLMASDFELHWVFDHLKVRWKRRSDTCEIAA